MTIPFIINHLWQSSWFALLAGLLVFVLRKYSPKVRYWVWLGASLKFLIPFALLVAIGGLIPTSIPHPVASPNALVRVAEPLSSAVSTTTPADVPLHWASVAIAVVWVLGFLAITLARYRSWLGVRAAIGAGTPIELPIAVRVVITPGTEEPGVVGFLRPILVLPAQLLEQLGPPQLGAILTHELCHVRRRDNFFASVHMVVEAIFWFHPLVWWIGSRLVEERELACDEEVLRTGCEPADYVEGILKVCRLYMESPLPCISGVTGADVKKRLSAILAGSIGNDLTRHQKMILAAIGLAALAVPVLMGVLNVSAAHAQNAPAATPKFEVASIKPDVSSSPNRNIRPEPGRLIVTNVPVKTLVAWAYNVREFQISGGPGWIDSTPYDIDGKVEGKPSQDQMQLMTQTLLSERFKLKLHRSTKELPIYKLTVAKEGFKLRPLKQGDCIVFDPVHPPSDPKLTASDFCGNLTTGRGTFEGVSASMTDLTTSLSQIVGRPVVDRTGIAGAFHFRLKYAPTSGPPTEGDNALPSSDNLPSLFAAVQEQLGLKLESAKGPVDVLVIEHAERPSPN